MRNLLVILIVLSMVGCATPPAMYTFNPVVNIRADYDAVWSEVVECFAIGNLPISTIEKDSGLIVTEWMDARGRSNTKERFCDCGSAALEIPNWTRGKFSVFAKETNDGSVDLRVTCMFQQKRPFGDTWSIVHCNSTGFLEGLVQDYVRAKVEGTAPPEVPTFKPGNAS